MFQLNFEWPSWEELRKKGALHFILVRGVLGWGGIMLLIFGPLTWLVISLFPKAAEQVTYREVLQFVAFFLLLGLAWGIVTWVVSEIQYRRGK